jgi:peptidyl-prolyl cis-trans isomerase B (cyclophilin B)
VSLSAGELAGGHDYTQMRRLLMSPSTLALVPMLLMLASCSGGDAQQPAATETAATTLAEVTTADTAAPDTAAAAAAPEEKPLSYYQGKVADLETSQGTITIRFFPDKAPNHVRNFIDLAEQGFYDGVRFHRVIPGFMIQGGDPNSKSDDRGAWGTGGSGRNVAAEFNDVSHKRGIVSMARSQDPDSASSQFFIVVKDSTFLDKQYTVFGEVVKGMDVADKIVKSGKGQEIPESPETIKKVTIRAET